METELDRLRKELALLRQEVYRRAQEDQHRADEEQQCVAALAAAERHRLEAAQEEEERHRREAEADALLVANLHAQAVAVSNIRAFVPVVLEVGSTSYSKWSGLHLITLGKYALTDHVLSDNTYPDVAPWLRMDCVVVSWIFGTISANLLETVMTSSDTNRQATSREVWLALEAMFVGNKETRTMILDTEFRTLVQGDLTISDYCRKLKTMADQLGSLGEPVLDRTLVLATLRGLNERFTHMAALLKRQKPFPTFDDVRNDLLLEEITLADRSQSPSTALLSTGSGSRPSTPGAHGGGAPSLPAGSTGGHGAPNNSTGSLPGGSVTSGGNRQNNRRHRYNRNNGGGNSGGNGKQPTAPGAQGGWPPSWFNPWTGTVQVWPGTPRPGGLGGPGIRPPSPQQAPSHALTAGPAGHPPGYGVPYGISAPYGLGYGTGAPLPSLPGTPMVQYPRCEQCWGLGPGRARARLQHGAADAPAFDRLVHGLRSQ
ncbi:uncharacterized protein LOC133920808 [Phragmites australis]|uniref:uncharacterized protein LOC133920808 n=1 Tax=Phragmites australis TaxID=29695 RepID=UPI002D7A1E97|nr:uncharacterized protein LOC133920808 [Phragmites australis]